MGFTRAARRVRLVRVLRGVRDRRAWGGMAEPQKQNPASGKTGGAEPTKRRLSETSIMATQAIHAQAIVTDLSEPALAQLRCRIAIAMRRHKVDDRNPRHVEAFLRSDEHYANAAAILAIKPLELERWVINAVQVLDTGLGASLDYDRKAETLGIPPFVYVDVFKELELL